jgi:hypothetical protein
MHDESLAQGITNYLFNDETMYRKHFIPCQYHMQSNPSDHKKVDRLVDSACKKFAETHGIPSIAIGNDVKKQVAIEVMQEMINNIASKR